MNSLLRKIKRAAISYWLVVKTVFRKFADKSDYERWSDPESLSPSWNPRTENIAFLIPSGSSVLEFGAGNMSLKNYLPADCKYTGSDLVDRGPGTIVCDLNGPKLPLFSPNDFAVFSGVLEYVNDVPRLIAHLSDVAEVIIASYVTIECVSSKIARRSVGWVNDFSSEELEATFSRSGFSLDFRETWQEQTIYRFVHERCKVNQKL